MSKPAKLILGTLTALTPLLFGAKILMVLFYAIPKIQARQPLSLYYRLSSLLVILLGFGLLVFYLVHLRRTNLIPRDRRSRWLLILWAFNIFAYPVYWYRFIWKEDSD